MLYSSADMWGLGCLLWESYNGPMKQLHNLKDVNNVRASENASRFAPV